MTKQTQVSSSAPKIASWLMIATYVVGAIGVFMGFATVSASTPSLTYLGNLVDRRWCRRFVLRSALSVLSFRCRQVVVG